MEKAMKLLVIVAAALSLVATTAFDASAASKAQKRYAKRQVPYASPEVGYGPGYPGAGGWYPRDASKLPFGSSIWWDQMRRERRTGGS